MVVAWVLVVALLFVLPALAWWVGARDVWSRPSKKSEPDLYRELVRRHSLRPAEAAQVEGAVTWGRELQDPRLRAAVVDWVTSLQRVADERANRRPRARRVVRVLGVVWLVFAIGWLVLTVARGDWERLLVTFFWPLVMAVPLTRLSRGPRRAVERNSGPPSAMSAS